MAGYEDTKRLIIETLMGRPYGTEIQPENHQAYALNMLEYIRSIELISGSSVIDIANEETVPVQPDNSRVSYISGIAQNRTMTFQNFIGQNGEALSITSGDMECYLIILLWNTEYWSLQAIPSNIISQAENATFYYRYNIRKTYNSVSSMNSDSTNPIGTDGKPIKVGDIVSVVNSGNASENAIYSRTENGWQFQSGMNFALVQETGNSVNSAMSQDAVTKEFDKQGIYNLDSNIPLKSGEYYSSSNARNSVPTKIRKIGLIITYKIDANNSVIEQFIGSSTSSWTTSTNWTQIPNINKISGRFIDYIYKPDYVPDLNKLNVGDYFITDLFDCWLNEKFIRNDGQKINLWSDIPKKTKIVFNANGKFDVFTLGESSFKKETINFVSKRYNADGISFNAFIGNNRYPFNFNLIYKNAYEDAGITDVYSSSIVIYYDIAAKSIKYKAYSVKYTEGVDGFSEIDLFNQIIIAILRNKGLAYFISEYFTWQSQQSSSNAKTKSNFILSEINEYTCNLEKVEDVLGTSYEFRNVIYSKHSPIELTEYQNSYWVLGIKTGGTKEFSNILYNGSPITIECKDNTVYLISIGAAGSEYSVTEFTKHIGNTFWKTVLFNGSLSLSAGTYIEFGLNSLSYDTNIPNGVIGVSKENTKIICIHVNGYESTNLISQIRAVTKNISFYNASPNTRNISSINIDNCRYEFDENATTSSSYILNFSDPQKGSVIIKNTEFIAYGNVYVFLYLSANYIEIDGNTFKTKWASHPIRINEASGYCSIRGNYVENGKTGIFLGSTRNSIIKNVIVESNIVKGCVEESISIDCFGNNTSLCSVIAKSYIDTFETDENARTTTINLKYLYYVEGIDSSYKAAIKEADFLNPLNYLFIICNGEHKYSIFEPISVEQIDYTGESGLKTTYKIIVKGYLPNLQNNDEVGFYSGFYNCVIRNNIVENAGNNKSAHGHGVSLWGGGYCCKIEGNSIFGCNNGIQMNGFGSFGVYDPAMFNYSLYNTIQNNVIRDCNKAFKFGAIYIPTVGYEYLRDAFTKIIGNTLINNGESEVVYTNGVLITSNIFDRSELKVENCTNELNENNLSVI